MRVRTGMLMPLLFLLIFAVNSGRAETVDKGIATVVVPDSRYNFENVVDGEIVTHDFILRNVGSAPLIIKDFKSG
jgi:hypothetical protein